MTQAFCGPSPSVTSQPMPIANQTLNASSPQFIPQSFQIMNPAPSTLVPVLQAQNSPDLINALAEAITTNRLPTLEPVVFMGDPLKFKDWCLSFETFILRTNIPKNKKLYYLRKYVGGAAKKAVEGHLLLGTEEAYNSAR